MNAPVAVFAYNRPQHLIRVLDALSECSEAKQTTLYIFCDGPKQNSDSPTLENINKVKRIAKNEVRFQKTTVFESKINQGLGTSIINGINSVLTLFDRIIVLEDDLIVHRDFLTYMNYYLNLYKNEEAIYHISGFQRDNWLQFILPRVFFTRHMNCSGWGTWKHKWEKLTLDLNAIYSHLNHKDNLHLFNYGKLSYTDQLHHNSVNLRTWSIFWYSTIQINNGLCLNPKFSYIMNIGDDGSGTNMGFTSANEVRNFVKEFIPVTPHTIKETKLNRYYITEAYWRKSDIKLKIIKKPLLTIMSNIRILLSPTASKYIITNRKSK